MKNYLVLGDRQEREKFISNIIRSEKIAEYSVFYFTNEIKIEQAKQIRKILSKRYSEKTLLVLASINTVAQNALLKSIEEVSENVSIIISVDDLSGILDTIKSRLFLIELGQNKEFDGIGFEALLSENISTKFQFIDNFLTISTESIPIDTINSFVNGYRKSFFNNLSKLNKTQIKHHLHVFKKLLLVVNLIKSNNVNLRFALESVFF